jgi:hypothetical protein
MSAIMSQDEASNISLHSPLCAGPAIWQNAMEQADA